MTVPKSTPTAFSERRNGLTVASTRMLACQRPAESRDTVTLDGMRPLGRVRDHRMSSGSRIFANVSSLLLSSHVNAVFINVADPPCDFLLNVG